MICDEAVKDCLVKACCTEICWEVRNLMEGNQRMVKSARAYAYGNMRKNEYCPVCHTQYFSYQFRRFSDSKSPIQKIYLVCDHCYAGINLVIDNHCGDWKIDYSYFPKLPTTSPSKDIKKLEDIFKLVNEVNTQI
jgi:hypothetical protein